MREWLDGRSLGQPREGLWAAWYVRGTIVRVEEVIWDDWNESHIARHRVTAEEVEEVLYQGRCTPSVVATRRTPSWAGPTPVGGCSSWCRHDRGVRCIR
jgi:hypothetical protein